jgi:uncharacterized protein (DUF1501 family)
MNRRQLLKSLGYGAIGSAAHAAGLDHLLFTDAYAAVADPTDYKALVCIFLLGGNDANNMIVPLDADQYAAYALARDTLALSQAELLPIQPANGGSYGLHPGLAKLHGLWTGGKLGIVANVGSLVEPLTREQYQARSKSVPYQLFSHSDQQQIWQSGNAKSPTQLGWGGQLASSALNVLGNFHPVVSVAGLNTFCRSKWGNPLVVPPAPSPLNKAFLLKHPGDSAPNSAMKTLLKQGAGAGSPVLVQELARLISASIGQGEALKDNPVLATVFPDTGLGNQLEQVAKLIKFAPTVGLKRQVFFCTIGSFDTHNNQGAATGNHADLLTELSNAMGAFYDATVELGVSGNVTSFTLSDFNRTLKPGGTGADIGTDHAWGSHHFVMGDAVAGGKLYGEFPVLALDGPNDADAGAKARGRWIPTLAVDQYAATLGTWFGVNPADLPAIFPNLDRFATSNLGFMV